MCVQIRAYRMLIYYWKWWYGYSACTVDLKASWNATTSIVLYSEKAEGSNERFSIFFQETRHWIDSIRVNGIFFVRLAEQQFKWASMSDSHAILYAWCENKPPCTRTLSHRHTDIHQIGLHFIIKMCVSVFFSSPNHFRMYM